MRKSGVHEEVRHARGEGAPAQEAHRNLFFHFLRKWKISIGSKLKGNKWSHGQENCQSLEIQDHHATD